MRDGYSFAGWDRGFTNVQSDLTVQAQYVIDDTSSLVIKEPPVPTSSGSSGLFIPGTNIPLFNGTGSYWSLFDLLCTIFSVLALLVGIIMAATRKKVITQRMGHDLGYRRIRGTWYDQEGKAIDEDEEGKRFSRKIPLVIVGVIAILLIILFIITQDLRQPMGIFDWWSIVFGIAFILAVVATILSRKNVRVRNDEEDRVQPTTVQYIWQPGSTTV